MVNFHWSVDRLNNLSVTLYVWNNTRTYMSQNEENTVFINLINYNDVSNTIECYNSIKNNNYSNYKIIIVDNGSKEEILLELKQKCNTAIIIENQSNLGFANASNVGINYSIENKANFILILNNDTIVDQNFLSELMSAAEENNDVELFTGKTLNYYRKNEICAAGSFLKKISGTSANHRGDGEIDIQKFEKDILVTFIPGYFCLVRTESFRKLGLFSTKYFLGGEEFDLNKRAENLNMKKLYVYRSKIWHKVSASHGKYAPRWVYNGYRNRMIYQSEHLPKLFWIIWYLLYRIYANTFAVKKLVNISNEWGGNLTKNNTKIALKHAFNDGANRSVKLEDLFKIDKLTKTSGYEGKKTILPSSK